MLRQVVTITLLLGRRAAMQRWPGGLMFWCACIIDLISFVFSAPNLRGLWADRHQILPRVSKLGQKFWGSLPPKIGCPKTVTFRRGSWQIRDLITNRPISGLTQDIVKRRCKLRSLPYMPTKFGELWSTDGEKLDHGIDPPKIYFFVRLYLRG